MALKLHKAKEILERNKRFIPGGVVSVNRAVEPPIVFVKGRGGHVWDADGNHYIDYHGAFGPFILGHNDPEVNASVEAVLRSGVTLMGSGTNPWEGELAELICRAVPSVEQVQLTNSGSEATYHALRLARAHTNRTDLIVIQGGYNGWHNDVALNVMTPLSAIGPRVSPGEYARCPLSAGIPDSVLQHVYVVNFNDLDSVRYVAARHPIAAIILEPVLQNIGVVKPEPGYLAGLRKLADDFGFLLIFDEVKTGFRHALGGYQSICNVRPDLSVFGKAIANGYPMGAIGGRADLMAYFTHPDQAKRVLIAGTYNAHPVTVAAAIATLKKLMANGSEVFRHNEQLGQRMEAGLNEIFRAASRPAVVSRQSSAFCVYFMDHAPRDWHDLASHHDFALDSRYRLALIERGIYHFPLATKQGSICFAHTEADIDQTLDITKEVVRAL
ncbi:MAG: aminotransferase class III-fold pyridoxal phosphate-dependent enzyme [Deinococcus sp.]|nr:aminotransferase class III-fold pyridoxal phosphate-dependent enzyme [Deinococcus sp.]